MMPPISFQLLAPNNPEVNLLGSWNDWQSQPMRQDDDGYWRIGVPLADGEYQYVFDLISNSPGLKGRRIQLPDPCALEWTWDDKTQLVIRNGKRVLADHTWQHDDKPLPSSEQQIIYELHVGDFSGGEGDEKAGGDAGTFRDVIDKLDYLTELGINAIELMPVTANPAGYQMGYSQLSYYTINYRYGSAREFAELVDACHARGIRVIHDCVYNHMASDAIWALIDYEYWFYEVNPDDHDFGPKLHYEPIDARRIRNPAQEYVFGSMARWMQEFHLDGIRFDFARALPTELLRKFRTFLVRAAAPRPFFAIAECLPENACIVGIKGPLDAAWTQTLMRQLITTALAKPHYDRNPFDVHALRLAFDFRVTGYTDAHSVINYIESHDEPHLMHIFREENSNLIDGAIYRRAKLAAALLLTAPGIPMLWMGQEFGESGPKAESARPLRWSLLDEPEHRDLWEFYRRLIHLRRDNPALYGKNFRVLVADQNDLVLAYWRWSDDNVHHVLVVSNLFDEPVTAYRLDTTQLTHGTWRDRLTDTTLPVTDQFATLSLAPSQVMVLCHEDDSDAAQQP